MPHEIERKFLVLDEAWRDASTGRRHLRQAYLARTDAAVVRVRTVDESEGTLTIKSSAAGLARQEFEYPIPVNEARALMKLAIGRPVEKWRYSVPASRASWEIDVFEGEHAGLVLAEIELADEGDEIPRPPWLGAEVTGDPRYYNAALAGVAEPEGD